MRREANVKSVATSNRETCQLVALADVTSLRPRECRSRRQGLYCLSCRDA